MKKNIIIPSIVLLFFVFIVEVVSAVRLPVVGGDKNNHGNILIDYLLVSHTGNGTLRNITIEGTDGILLQVNGSSNNIGIGTASPSEKLTVIGNISATGNIYGQGQVLQQEVNAFKLINFTNAYDNKNDRFQNNNWTSLYNSITDRFGLGNFTALINSYLSSFFNLGNFTTAYDARSDRFGNSNFTSQYDLRIDRYSKTNLTIDYPNLDIDSTNDFNFNNFTIPVNYYVHDKDNMVNEHFFIADRNYNITTIKEVHKIAESGGGSVNLQVEKLTGTTASGSGIGLLTDNSNNGFNLKSAANTVQNGTLTVTSANLLLATGDRLGVFYTGSLSQIKGIVVTVSLQLR